MKQFTDALLVKVGKKKHHHHHTHEEKDGSTSAKKNHHKSKESKKVKHHHKHTSKNKDLEAPLTTDPLVLAAQPVIVTAKSVAAPTVADETPAEPSPTPAKVSSPLVAQHSIVELLHETNPKIASHAHDIIEKRQSAELIFSGVGTDAHGLHGRLAPPHRMTVTQAGIHYLTTDEAVSAMDRNQAEKQEQNKEMDLENSEDEPIGKKPPKRESQKEEEEPLGKVVKRNRV